MATAPKSTSLPPYNPNGPAIEEPDAFIIGIMFGVGKEYMKAYDALKDGYPGWANLILGYYHTLDQIFGGK